MDIFKAMEAVKELEPALQELREFRKEVAAARREINDARLDMAKLTLELQSRMAYLSPILENIAHRQTEIELMMMGVQGKVGIT